MIVIRLDRLYHKRLCTAISGHNLLVAAFQFKLKCLLMEEKGIVSIVAVTVVFAVVFGIGVFNKKPPKGL